MPILCLKSLKTGVPKAKSAQNPDYVLETPENGGPEGKKSTKTHFLCSNGLKTRFPKPKSAQQPYFCAREDRDWHREGRKLVSESITADTFIVNVAFLQITAHTSKTQMSHNQIINF